MRVWVSELSTTAARTREEAKKIAQREVQEAADAIRGHIPSLKGAFSLFDDRVQNLKSFIQSSR